MPQLPTERATPQAARLLNSEDKIQVPPAPLNLVQTIHRRVVGPLAIKLIMAILFIAGSLPKDTNSFNV